MLGEETRCLVRKGRFRRHLNLLPLANRDPVQLLHLFKNSLLKYVTVLKALCKYVQSFLYTLNRTLYDLYLLLNVLHLVLLVVRSSCLGIVRPQRALVGIGRRGVVCHRVRRTPLSLEYVSRDTYEGRDNVVAVWLVDQLVACLCQLNHLLRRSELG